jgi:hypothetical protein
MPARGWPVLGVAGLIALAGCSSGHPQAAASSHPPASPAPASTSPVASTAPATPPPATPTPSAAPSSPASPVALGQLSGLFAHGSGFGQVKPAMINNGGDPTGLVTGLTWQSWGASRATGTGQAEWVGPHQSVATGSQQQATVVAFRLGTCNGKRMYRAVEWYFPQHGQSFSARHYEDICSGKFVPGG